MATSTCSTCHALLLSRLRARLSYLVSIRTSSQVRSHSHINAQDPPILAYHWDTIAPNSVQLKSATSFFITHPPRKLWTATEWRKQGHANASSTKGPGTQLIPEVTFLGRSNVGKSSLLNALLLSPLLNHVGPRPGKTTMMHAWALSASNPVTSGAGPGGEMDVRLAVLDVPGYGYGSRADSGKEIVTYLRQRRQLRRAFVLVDALHGIKSSDEHMIQLLRNEGISYQIIVSKADRLLATSKRGGTTRLQAFFELLRRDYVQPEGRTGLAGFGEILAVGNLGDGRKNTKSAKEKDMLGIEQVRYAVLVAAGLEQSSTKPTTSSLDQEIDAGQKARVVLREIARQLGMQVPPNSPYPVHPYEIPNLPPANQTCLFDSSLSPSDPPHRTQTHKSSSPISFLTPARNAQAPPYSPPAPSPGYQSVGGLADLEAAIASKNPPRLIPKPSKSSSKSQQILQPKLPYAKKEKKHVSKEQKEARQLEWGARIMGDSAASAAAATMRGSEVGVGGMADLLAMAGGRRRGGSGGGRGTRTGRRMRPRAG